jgi:hypothetical protein
MACADDANGLQPLIDLSLPSGPDDGEPRADRQKIDIPLTTPGATQLPRPLEPKTGAESLDPAPGVLARSRPRFAASLHHAKKSARRRRSDPALPDRFVQHTKCRGTGHSLIAKVCATLERTNY